MKILSHGSAYCVKGIVSGPEMGIPMKQKWPVHSLDGALAVPGFESIIVGSSHMLSTYYLLHHSSQAIFNRMWPYSTFLHCIQSSHEWTCDKTTRDKTIRDKTIRDKTTRDKTTRDKAIHDKTTCDETSRDQPTQIADPNVQYVS